MIHEKNEPTNFERIWENDANVYAKVEQHLMDSKKVAYSVQNRISYRCRCII